MRSRQHRDLPLLIETPQHRVILERKDIQAGQVAYLVRSAEGAGSVWRRSTVWLRMPGDILFSLGAGLLALCLGRALLAVLRQPFPFLDFATMALRDETCIPCDQGGSTLNEEDLKQLSDALPGWEVIEQHHLHKRLSFPDFATALGWLTSAAAICEQQGHHADFRVGWGYVEIDIHTHRVNGLTRADAVLAAKFEAMAC